LVKPSNRDILRERDGGRGVKKLVDPNTSGRGDGRVGDHGGEAAPEQRQQAGGGHGGGGKVLEEEEDGERPVRDSESVLLLFFSF
jgi:hypothetical protein